MNSKTRSFVSTCLAAIGLVAGLTACSGSPANLGPMMARPMQSMARAGNVRLGAMAAAPQIRQNPAELMPLFKDLYKEVADSMQQGKPTPAVDQLLQQKGPAAYAALGQDGSLRAQLYSYSDPMVMKEYNKPSPADAVPPIAGAELQALIAKLQPGDVVLCGNDGSFVHALLYLGQGQIVHSLATQPDMHDRFRGVVKESLATYTARSERDTFVVLRARNLNPQAFARAANYAVAQVGKGYDSLFLNASDERFYCTELVWKALRQVAGGPRVLPHPVKYGWEMVTVEDFMDSPDFETVWTRNRQRNPIGKMHRY